MSPRRAGGQTRRSDSESPAGPGPARPRLVRQSLAAVKSTPLSASRRPPSQAASGRLEPPGHARPARARAAAGAGERAARRRAPVVGRRATSRGPPPGALHVRMTRTDSESESESESRATVTGTNGSPGTRTSAVPHRPGGGLQGPWPGPPRGGLPPSHGDSDAISVTPSPSQPEAELRVRVRRRLPVPATAGDRRHCQSATSKGPLSALELETQA